MSYEDNHKYDDIINLPHHVSTTHPHMSLADRAAQFSPFAALTGHDDAIKETARLTDERPQLDENKIEMLNAQLQFIKEHLDEKLHVTFTYYVPDAKKEGGAYESVTGVVKKIDEYEHKVVLEEGISILIRELIAIEVLKRKL